MRNLIRSGYGLSGSLILLFFVMECSRVGERPTGEAAESGEEVKEVSRPDDEGGALESPEFNTRSSEQQSEVDNVQEDASPSTRMDDREPPPVERPQATETGMTIVSDDDLGPPVSLEELMDHPLMKEMARRERTRVKGLRVEYDFSGPFGADGIADRSVAYLGSQLIGEGKALRLVGQAPSKLEVEETHYSASGSVIYRGTVLFVVGNVWKPGDDPVPPGAPFSSTAIEGSKERTIFSSWPVGAPY